MSILKLKSEINLSAAEHLQDWNFFLPVVHCAYYSCVQLMRHILLFERGWSDYQMERERKTEGRLGPHEYLISKIEGELNLRETESEFFIESIYLLKKMRVNADYKNRIISKSESKRSIQLSNSIINHLTTNFTL